MADVSALEREVELLEKKNALLERNRKLESKSTVDNSDILPKLTPAVSSGAAKKRADWFKAQAEEAARNPSLQAPPVAQEAVKKAAAKRPLTSDTTKKRQDVKAASLKKVPPKAPTETSVQDWAESIPAPSKKPATAKNVMQDTMANAKIPTADGTGEKKKKKKRRPAPSYGMAAALSRGEEIPGLTDRPKPQPRIPASAPARPQVPRGGKAEVPKPEEAERFPEPPPTPQVAAKKPAAAAQKKEKTYHPDAMRSTKEIMAERELEEERKNLEKRQKMRAEANAKAQGGQGQGQGQGRGQGQGGVGDLAGGALGGVNNLGQGALGTVGQVGSNLPVAGGAVNGATRGVGKTLDGTTRGLGETTGALGKGDLGGTIGGVGNTVSGLGKGLVSGVL